MKIIIRDNAKEGSLWAAHYIASKINEKAARTSEPFVLGLCTGSTPIETYAELIRMVKDGEVFGIESEGVYATGMKADHVVPEDPFAKYRIKPEDDMGMLADNDINNYKE